MAEHTYGMGADCVCQHGIHMDNACGACTPPRGTTGGVPAADLAHELARVAAVTGQPVGKLARDLDELDAHLKGKDGVSVDRVQPFPPADADGKEYQRG